MITLKDFLALMVDATHTEILARRPGIIVWLENGNVLIYIPKPEKE